MPTIYTTVDGKTLSVGDILYIDKIDNTENALKGYNIKLRDGTTITVAHESEEMLKKDRRKLELTWERQLNRK